MSSPWTTHIPAACKVQWLEQGSVDQMGGPPPIRIIPVQTSKSKAKSSVSIKITNGVKQEITKFAGGSCEEALRHVQLFFNLEKKLQYRLKIAKAKKVKKDQEEAQALIRDDNSDASQNRED